MYSPFTAWNYILMYHAILEFELRYCIFICSEWEEVTLFRLHLKF